MAEHNTNTWPSQNAALKNGLRLASRMRSELRVFVFILFSVAGVVATETPLSVAQELGPSLTFDNVYPAILLRCTRCHGARLQEAELDLRTRESMLRGGRSGPVMVPGAANRSLIIQKLRAGKMPPPKRLVEASVTEISETEVSRISQWD